MRRIELQLLVAIVLLPAVARAQEAIAPINQSSATPVATLESEEMVPAAELEQALQELETVHAQNYQTLAGLTEQVPEAARPAIKRAMDNSQRGWQRARDNRQRAQAKRQAKMQQGKGVKPTWAGQGGRQGYRPTQMQGAGGRPEQTGQQPQTANNNQQFRDQGGAQQQRGQSGSRGQSGPRGKNRR